MKELILQLIQNLSRDCRETATLRFEQQDIDAETFRLTALRLDELYGMVDDYLTLSVERAKAAARWQFLFGNAEVTFQIREPEILIFQRVMADGEVKSLRLIGRGVSFSEAVDNALKING